MASTTATPNAPSTIQNLKPLTNTIVFNGPCYIITAGVAGASLVLQPVPSSPIVDPIEILVPLSPTHFTKIEGGETFAVTIGNKSFPASASQTFGPDSWGILQPVDGGVIGYELAMASPSGGPLGVLFKNPTRLPPGWVGSNDPLPTRSPATKAPPAVTIVNRGIWSGVSDSSALEVAYKYEAVSWTTELASSGQQSIPPVGGEGPDHLLTATLSTFIFKTTPETSTYWGVSEPVHMEPNMSLVVIGSFSAASLAIMVPI